MSAAYEYLRNQPAARALQRYAKRALGVFRWSMAGARAIAGQRTGKRLLVVYDLASQPFSVGDILVFRKPRSSCASATDCRPWISPWSTTLKSP
jgi:hypothetical protein